MDASKPDKESGDPFVLLASRIPLRELVNKHGFDITELINDHGVTINDFFRSGYTLGEMCDAFSSRMNQREGMDVLYYLGVAAEHIRALPQLMPVEVLRDKLGYKPEMLQTLGFSYEEAANVWTIPDMIRVGLTMPLVMKAGLCTRSGWDRLKATASTHLQLLAFGATPDVEAILDMVSPPAVAQQQQQPPVVEVTPPVYHSETSLKAVPGGGHSYSYFPSAPAPTPVVQRQTYASAVVAPTHQAIACSVATAVNTVGASDPEFTHAPGVYMPRPVQMQQQIQQTASRGPRLVPKRIK
jgi:hypothetical protein